MSATRSKETATAKNTPDTAKSQALKVAMAAIEKQFGKGALMRMGDRPTEAVAVVSTGSPRLDNALGVGGLPRGRVVEVYGPESSGKTTLTLQTVAEAQRMGLVAAFIDAEHALDPAYAKSLGVDVDNLLISQPDSGEQALSIAEKLAASSAVGVIVIDSVAALTPKAEIEGEMGDSHVGLQARLMSQALRKLTGIISSTGTMLIFINQIRMKIGVSWGSPETTTGGNALKFYASVRLDIRRTGSWKDAAGNVLGNELKIKVVKNKVAPPFKVVETRLVFGQGFSALEEAFDYGVDSGKLEKSGAWYSYAGEKVCQGRIAAVNWLSGHPELVKEWADALRMGGLPQPPQQTEEGGE